MFYFYGLLFSIVPFFVCSQNLEKIVEHNRTLQREVQQLRWDKGELRRKWAAHRKLCPCFRHNLDTMAIKTEPISDDEEEEESADMKKVVDSEGQENDMELSFASIASVLCSSPIAGFPKNFPEIANISEISDESLPASLCNEMVSCSPSALGVVDASFLHDLHSPAKSKKDSLVMSQGSNRSPSSSSQNQISIQTSQAPSSSFPAQGKAISCASASISTTTSTNTNNNSSNNDIRYNLNVPSVWQQSAHSPDHHQQKHSSYTGQSSCRFGGNIPQVQGYYNTCQQQQPHMQIPQYLSHTSQHQPYPSHHRVSIEQDCRHSQYSENHSNNNSYHVPAALSMSTSSTNPAACVSPVRQRCAATGAAQTPKSVQYPDLCRLLQPHPSPAQVVPSLSTSPGDSMRENSPSSSFNGSANTNITNCNTSVAPGASHQPNFLCTQPRSVLASGGSTPDTVRVAARDGDRGRCSSDSSDGSGHKVPPSTCESLHPRRSTETPDFDNDDVFSGPALIQNNPVSVSYGFDTNNNSALVNNNNSTHSNTDIVTNSSRTSTQDVMLFSQDGEAETSSVLEGVRHLIDCSGYSNCVNSSSETPSSISSNSSISSEVDDLLFEIPSDALLFFGANSEVDAPHAMFPDSM